ncbi:C2H2 transcription factor (Rpn4) [Arthroderma uncinatum]|uniref:C2H2 transcription factor (Rpn4) n=1 Tax=Arthroderma uncinatum TaxID=74035 RepID=UPI00144AA59C|nr:C2H2 transcription factor (Rpn4) [Arthroderma uncinatum]KAF3482981.1 C2H2 transcription factor (Rpn4) [Arthroderma uncinatum]
MAKRTDDQDTHLATSQPGGMASDTGSTLAGLEPSMNDGHNVDLSASQSEGATSDAGIYSCTYHSCTRRFERRACMMKHRRTHQVIPSQGLSVRNSRAGPHRCDRTNPSTGRPCSTEFSRPYDLTRHEDTIHNVSKQKTSCHECEEAKTFSRADALKRHMRVVHPNVTWPGKRKLSGREY